MSPSAQDEDAPELERDDVEDFNSAIHVDSLIYWMRIAHKIPIRPCVAVLVILDSAEATQTTQTEKDEASSKKQIVSGNMRLAITSWPVSAAPANPRDAQARLRRMEDVPESAWVSAQRPAPQNTLRRSST